jgi:hypothetical protein
VAIGYGRDRQIAHHPLKASLIGVVIFPAAEIADVAIRPQLAAQASLVSITTSSRRIGNRTAMRLPATMIKALDRWAASPEDGHPRRRGQAAAPEEACSRAIASRAAERRRC